MITRYLLGAAMFEVGMTAAIQPPINAALAKRTGGLESATISFAVGTAVLLLLTVVLGNGSLWAARGAPAWQWTGGTEAWHHHDGSPHEERADQAAGLIAGVVAGQLVGGVVIDRFGLFG